MAGICTHRNGGASAYRSKSVPVRQILVVSDSFAVSVWVYMDVGVYVLSCLLQMFDCSQLDSAIC
jgi:hypothetical protein